MKLIAYRHQKPNEERQADQRWTVIELDADAAALTDGAAQVKRADVPVDVTAFLIDTDTLPSWTVAVSVTKD